MALIDQTFKDEVRAKNDIVEVISSYVKLERRGNRCVGLCPFHGEKTPSFHVIPHLQIYHCFGCKASGDVYKFVQERDHLTFFEALVQLAKRAHIPLPQEERSPEEEQAYRERRALFDALEMAARFFHHQLTTEPGREGLEYLQGRGLSDDTIRRFQLGWAPGYGKLFQALRSRFSPTVLEKAGLIVPRREGSGFMDTFFGRVMFPITDLNGRVLGFGGRILQGNAPKYKNTADTTIFAKREVLFGVAQAKDAMRAHNQAILVEGYMDVITPHQAGVTNVVAPLGTALTDEQCQLLRRQAEQVVVAFDSDTAGQMATLRGLEKLYETGCDVRILQLPDGKDPDEFIRAHGVAGFQQCVAEAIPLVEFKLRLAMNRGASTSPEAKARAVEAVARVLVDLKNDILREEYTRRVANELASSPLEVASLKTAIARQMNRVLRQGFQHNQPNSRNNIRDLGLPHHSELPSQADARSAMGRGISRSRTVTPADLAWRAERTLVQLLLHNPGLMARIEGIIGEHPFDDPIHTAIYESARAATATLDPYSGNYVARILDTLSDAEARLTVSEMAATTLVSVNSEQEAADCIEKIKQHRVSRRIEDLENLFKTTAAAGDRVPDAVLQEYTRLQQQKRASKS